MKTITKILLLLVILTSTLNMNGQDDFFSPSRFPEILYVNNYSASTTYYFYNSQIKVYNVNFYFLDLTTGGGYPSGTFNENYALKSIAALNIAFNPYNIFFKHRGVQVHSEIYNGSELTNQYDIDIINRMYEFAQDEGTDNNINIVLSHTICQPVLGSADIYKKMISLRYCEAEPNHLIYQMGHIFGLLKTHRDTGELNSGIYTDINYCNSDDDLFYSTELKSPNFQGSHIDGTPWIPENVTRDINNVNYNANIAGDMVVDTPACFKGSENSYCHYNADFQNGYPVYYNTYEYISHPSIVDNSSEQLMYEDVDILNYMSYNIMQRLNWRSFTDGQGVRMRETIAIPSLNFSAVETDIASLYKPYKEETEYSFQPYSVSDNGDGTAEVCKLRGLTFTHYFQPGFDYEFYGYGITNFDHNASSHEISAIIDNGIYKFVKINQINPIFLVNGGFDASIIDSSDLSNSIIAYNLIVCNRPAVVCETEPFDSGKVISTTNLANPNISIKVLDNQEASDPNLEQNLENNKYHIIEKTTTSGEKIQKTIYKSGN